MTAVFIAFSIFFAITILLFVWAEESNEGVDLNGFLSTWNKEPSSDENA